VRVDECGHQLSGASQTGVARYDVAVRSLLLFRDDVADAWEATVADDPGFTIGHIGRAYLRCLSSEAPDAAEARQILAPLREDGLTDRERRHLAAARAYASGDLHGAGERLAALSVEYPLDALALAVGHQLDFFCGDAAGLRDRPGRVLATWDEHHPLFGFVLGMHAFGLEESNLYPQAEVAGMRALDAEARDVWAIHAVVHVHEMQARIEAGLRFMDERRDDWTTGNLFVVHNAWHEALFRSESGDIDGALAIYDTTLHHEGSTNVALEMLDATALLWRLHLDGIDVGDRWAPLADAWADKTEDESWYVFNDMHAVMAYVGDGRLDHARSLVGRLRDYTNAPPAGVANAAMTIDVGLAVCDALLAFGEHRYADTVAMLHPIRRIVHRIGGSNAQRDAVARTLLEAAMRSGNQPLAEALISERLAVKDTSPYNRRQLDRIQRARPDDSVRRLATTTA
jgi:hypothetical protein